MRKHRRKAILQTPRFEEEGGGEGAPVPGTVIFHGEGNEQILTLQPVEDLMVQQVDVR